MLSQCVVNMMLSLTGVFGLSPNEIVVLGFGFVYCPDGGVKLSLFVHSPQVGPSQFVLPYSDGLQNGQ